MTQFRSSVFLNKFSENCILFSVILIILQNSVNCFFLSRSRLLSNNPNDIKFYIYPNTSDTDAHNEIIYGNEKSIVACGYDPNKSLILLVHGFLSNYQTFSDLQPVKTAYLETQTPSNIIMVDYGKLTVSRIPLVLSPLSILLTIYTILRTTLIATRIADFLKFLMDAKVLQGPDQVHIIGLSIGAHISGVAASLVHSRTKTLVCRVTGLDPSPAFPQRRYKLISSNAKFVDVSYTTFAKYGSATNLIGQRQGHVQFYINGGDVQPNCPNLIPFIHPFCSHATASYYFAKSIKRKDIPACKCIRCRGSFLERLGKVRRYHSPNCRDPINYGQYVPLNATGNYQVILS